MIRSADLVMFPTCRITVPVARFWCRRSDSSAVSSHQSLDQWGVLTTVKLFSSQWLTVTCASPQIKFKQGTVQTPELLQDVEIPASVTVLGQAVDLTALKSALQPVTSGLQGAVQQVRAVSEQDKAR